MSQQQYQQCRQNLTVGPSIIPGILLALALWTIPANAQTTIYTTFDTGDTFSSAGFWCITGVTGANCGGLDLRQIAAPFTTGTAARALSSMSLALGRANASGNGVIISLAQDASGSPGNIVESWTVANLPSSSAPALTTVDDRLNLLLSANSTYWVIVQPMNPRTSVVWYQSSLGLTGAKDNHGSGWNLLPAPATQPAFSVGTVQRSSFAHIAAGGGWTTAISLVNTSLTETFIAGVTFYDENGATMSLPITTTQQGITQSSNSTNVSATLKPNETWLVSIGGQSGTVAVGSARVQGSYPLDGFAIFHYGPSDSEGTVPLQTQSPYSIILPFDNTAGLTMGVALTNTSSSTQNITATVLDDSGNPLGSPGAITLAANGHTSFVLPTQYPATAAKRGIIQFTASGSLSAIGLRFSPSFTFTSVPPILTGPSGQ